jgi:signal transduction histidine kinase
MLMQGYIELLRLKGHELSPERQASLIQRASQAGDDLVELLQSILDVRRLGQGVTDYSPAPVSVLEAVSTAATLVDPREGHEVERELRVDVPEDLAIWGERIRLQQILTNLLSNANKYSPPGTPVQVTARQITEQLPGHNRRLPGSRSERQMVEIIVSDHGLGIPPDQIPLLFQRFVRLPRDLASTVSGNGLGLYLCRELSAAMGGTIWVESSGVEGEGSRFHICLPMPPQTFRRVTLPPQATPAQSPATPSSTVSAPDHGS